MIPNVWLALPQVPTAPSVQEDTTSVEILVQLALPIAWNATLLYVLIVQSATTLLLLLAQPVHPLVSVVRVYPLPVCHAQQVTISLEMHVTRAKAIVLSVDRPPTVLVVILAIISQPPILACPVPSSMSAVRYVS